MQGTGLGVFAAAIAAILAASKSAAVFAMVFSMMPFSITYLRDSAKGLSAGVVPGLSACLTLAGAAAEAGAAAATGAEALA